MQREANMPSASSPRKVPASEHLERQGKFHGNGTTGHRIATRYGLFVRKIQRELRLNAPAVDREVLLHIERREIERESEARSIRRVISNAA